MSAPSLNHLIDFLHFIFTLPSLTPPPPTSLHPVHRRTAALLFEIVLNYNLANRHIVRKSTKPPSGAHRPDSLQSSLAALFVSAFELQCQQVFTVLSVSAVSEAALMSTLASLIETAQAVALSQCEAESDGSECATSICARVACPDDQSWNVHVRWFITRPITSHKQRNV